MNNFVNAVGRFIKDEEGASAIEYALILGMVALAIVSLSGTIRDKVTATFQSISDSL